MSTEMNYSYTMRQNMYDSMSCQLSVLKRRKKLISPWNHTKKQYDDNNIRCKYAQVFTDIEINSNIVILASDSDKILLVKVISELKKEICDDLFIIRHETRSCEHDYITHGCKLCVQSIIKIVNCIRDDVEEVKDFIVEQLYTFYTDIEILQELNKNLYNFTFIQSSIGKMRPEKNLTLKSTCAKSDGVNESNDEFDVSNESNDNHHMYYERENKSNGDIIFTPYNINIDEYDRKELDDGKILFSKINENNVELDGIKNYEFSRSEIIKCRMYANTFNNIKYRHVLDKLYAIIDDGFNIIKNTTLNIKTINKNDSGYRYYPELGISVQGADTKKILYEIVHQCEKNNISLLLKISLLDNTRVSIAV